jgi:hypothetical protein
VFLDKVEGLVSKRSAGNEMKQMESKNSSSNRPLRFCEICGAYAGSLNEQEWDLRDHICEDCAKAFSSSIEIELEKEKAKKKNE